MMRTRTLYVSLCALTLIISGCSLFGASGPTTLAIIGTSTSLSDPDAGPLSPPSAILGAAVAQGLVSFDGDGRVTAGLAERWTVTDDGLSYIFRIRAARWSDGGTVTTRDIADIMNRRRANPRHSFYPQLAAVTTVRAMTDHVIEIRLNQPQPDLLTLFAQPEMGLMKKGRGWGPYRISRGKNEATLTPAPDPVALEMGEDDAVRAEASLKITVSPAGKSMVAFRDGATDAVLGGRFQDWPYIAASRVNGNQIQIDPAAGLFGFQVVDASGALGDRPVREAINIAIHRSRILSAFELEGWTPIASIRPINAVRDANLPLVEPDWATSEPDARKSRARQVISAWKSRSGKARSTNALRLRIAMPDGPGSRILFAYVRADLRLVGADAVRVPMGDPADLRMIDDVAPTDDPLWFAQRLSCASGAPCSARVAEAILAAQSEADPARRFEQIVAIEKEMLSDSYYIPIATPLRWSAVSGRLSRFRSNVRARHPLNQL